MDQVTTSRRQGAPVGFREFVALIASLMAMVAFGIDTMLPALPEIGRALDVATVTDRQYVITVFGIGFGVAQLVHGPLVDRFGRRPVLLVSLAAYIVANVLAAVSASFPLLLTARFFGGASIAATRVATVAMVRDCYEGRAMARIMSLAFMVFMAAPIVAPALGEGILLFGDWRAIFWTIGALALGLAGWVAWRVPETQAAEDRGPIRPARILADWRTTLRDRYSLGYTLAAAALTAALYGYLGSIEPIMAETFRQPRMLLVVFAVSAGTMAAANLLNATLVMRLGTRSISHGALVMMILVTTTHLLVAGTAPENIWTYTAFQAVTLGCFGLAASNFSAMAMDRMGHIAGTASSVQGFVSITFGSALGILVGKAFDGTTVPLTAAFLLAALVALGIAFVVERGRLFAAG